jgi:hypothetical protein
MICESRRERHLDVADVTHRLAFEPVEVLRKKCEASFGRGHLGLALAPGGKRKLVRVPVEKIEIVARGGHCSFYRTGKVTFIFSALCNADPRHADISPGLLRE